jgi:hypothetical protein
MVWRRNGVIYHHLMPGETLFGIAHQHYGDPHLLQVLAHHNHVANVNHLVAGRFLELPKIEHRIPKACQFCSLTPAGATSVDDSKTWAMINQALAEASGHASGNYDKKLGRALRRLQASRQVTGASLDMNLAAAEHYMLARWWVGTGYVNPLQMRTVVVGWDADKILNKLRGQPEANQVTKNPASPPDADVTRWGLKGVSDGVIDHDQFNPGVSPPLYRPLDELMGKKFHLY